MILADVASRVGGLPEIAAWRDALAAGGAQLAITPGVEPFVLAGVQRPLVAVTATGRQAEDLRDALQDLGRSTGFFPAWETLPHERLSPTAETVGRRMAVIGGVAAGNLPDVLLVPIRALMQPFAADLADERPLVLESGAEPGFDAVVAGLARAGYERVPMVERRGQFAVRGGLIDVFVPTEEHPTRVEFFGDEVEELRSFAVSDQRTLSIREAPLSVPACRELLLTPQVRERARALIDAYPHIADVLADLAAGTAVEGMESLAPVLTERMITLLDLLPEGTPIVNVAPERIAARAVDLVRTSEEFLQAGWHNAAVGNVVPLDLSRAAYRSTEELGEQAGVRGLPVSDLGTLGSVVAGLKPAPVYRGDVPALARDAGAAVAAGIPVVIAMGATGPGQRLAEQLSGLDVAVRLFGDSPLDPVVHIVKARLTQGFSIDSLVLVTERDLTGTASTSVSKMPAKRRNTVDPLALKPGDLVVHDQHGIGRFVEMVQRTVGGAAPRVPGAGVRARQARPGRRQAVRADGLAGPGVPVRRRRGADTAPAGRRRLGEHEGQGAQGGARDRRRAGQALRGAAGRARVTRSARTPRGSPRWRTRSRSPRPSTSSPPSTRSRPTWRSRSRWTG